MICSKNVHRGIDTQCVAMLEKGRLSRPRPKYDDATVNMGLLGLAVGHEFELGCVVLSWGM